MVLVTMIIAAIAMVACANRMGALSPAGLLFLHLALGFVVKWIYTSSFDPHESSLLAPFALAPNKLPWLEGLAVCAATLISYFLLSLLFDVNINIPKFLRAPNDVSYWAYIILSSFSMFLAVAPFIFYAVKSGGLGAAASLLSGRVVDDVEGLGYLFAIGDLGICGIIVSVHFFYRNPRARSRFFYILSVAAGVAVLALSGGRGNLIQFLISVFILRELSVARLGLTVKPLVKFGIVVVAALIIISGLTLRKANQFNESVFDVWSDVSREAASALISPFALIDHYALSRIYVEENGFDYGETFLNFATKPIPRSMWPNKPETLAIQVRRHFWGDELGGIPPGIYGEGYIALGFVGALIISVVIGAVGVMATRVYNQAKFDQSLMPLCALIVPYFAFNLIRSGWDISFSRMTIYIVSMCVVYKFVVFVDGLLNSDEL